MDGIPSDEYELVNKNQLDYLRHEVEKIKKNPFGDTESSKDLLGALAELNRNIAKFNAIMESAHDEIVRDYKENTQSSRVNTVVEQNEKLAKGLVAIADLLRELKEQNALTSEQAAKTAAAVHNLHESQAVPPPAHPPQPAQPAAEPKKEDMTQWQSVVPEHEEKQEDNPFLQESITTPPKKELPPLDPSEVPPPPPQ